MKRIITSFVVTILFGQLFAQQQMIEEVKLSDGTIMKVDRSVFPDLKFDEPSTQPKDYAERRKARAKGLAPAIKLPPYVYNNLLKYYSPVFSQDGGSCGSAQAIGYQFTYEMNLVNDADATQMENRYPSHFTWLQAYQGSNTQGMAKGNGIPNAVVYGGRTYSKVFGNQSCQDPDYGWMQGYDKWYSAMFNRLESDFQLSKTNTEQGRRELKEWLYNHGGDETLPYGGLAGIGVAIYGDWQKIPKTTNNDANGFTNLKYVKQWGEVYNHAVTICGYDDRVEFDLDGDGIIGEEDEDEVGAWIVCNSWGDWENHGFIYCPYKYSVNCLTDKGSWEPGVQVIRRNYRPLRTIKVTMDFSRRSELCLNAGISQDINADEPDRTILFEHFNYSGDASKTYPGPETPMLGRWVDGMHYEPMEFGYDLTDLTSSYDRTKPLKYFFIIKTKYNGAGTGHIKSASIINYEIDDEGLEIPFPDSNVEIKSAGTQTIISVVVPGEQLNPATNLEYTDGVLSWTAPRSSLKLAGYHVYSGSTVIADLPATQTYYTPDENLVGPFKVCAYYEAGKNLQEADPSNSISLEFPEPHDNCVLSMNEAGITIPNAIPNDLTKATIEFWIKPKNLKSYINQIGPGWGKFLFHIDSSGKIYCGWNTGATDRITYSASLNTNRWTHVACVIDGNIMSLILNGVKKASVVSGTYSGLTGFGNLKLGTGSTDKWWEGYIDEFRVWKCARTVTDIKNSMRMPIARPDIQNDLIVYLPMDTIVENGVVKYREWINGKHAVSQGFGEVTTELTEAPFEGTQYGSRLTISKPTGTLFAGVPVQLNAQTSVNAISCSWEAPTAKQKTYNCMSPTIVFDEVGTHTVNCTAIFNTGDTLTKSTDITIQETTMPVADFDINNAELPAGDRFSFINRSKGDNCTYDWNMPGADAESFRGTNATALYPQEGTYDVTLTASNHSGSHSVTKQVTVKRAAPSPLFDISKQLLIVGDTLQLIDNSRYSPLTWNWELNNQSRAFRIDKQNATVVLTAPGVYDVSLTVGNEIGNKTATKNRYLMVSNEDSKQCLNFTGSEKLQIESPFTIAQRYITVDWWMRPTQLEGCFNLVSSKSTYKTSVSRVGAITISEGNKSITSDEGFFIANEWHHYAITISSGLYKFYRDGVLICTPSDRLNATVPLLGTVTVGNGTNNLCGQIDEVRVWGKTLTQTNILSYCNQSIKDIADAESTYKLCLYYDFNQTGGDVIDRSSKGNDAKRINFGPDGDAWNNAGGVFTLDLEAPCNGDVAAKYLTNYKNPFLTNSGTVNSNNSSRFLKLSMGTIRSKWQQANEVVSGGITTGAHIDTDHHNDIQFETQWSGFADKLQNYKLWHPVTLPAGRYTFGVEFGDVGSTQESKIVACLGSTMIDDADCETKALAYAMLNQGSITFELSEETQISVGIIVNISGQESFGIHAFYLNGYTYEDLVESTADAIVVPYADTTPQTKFRGIYDISGRKVGQRPVNGIYIEDGKKKM